MDSIEEMRKVNLPNKKNKKQPKTIISPYPKPSISIPTTVQAIQNIHLL